MDDLISRKQIIKALEEWEKIYTWDDWCRMHNDEKEKYNITAPSDVLKKTATCTTLWCCYNN